jgi:ABC-type uncharacterized transport system substrate-binding protein
MFKLLRQLLITLLWGLCACAAWAEVKVVVVNSDGLAASSAATNAMLADLLAAGVGREAVVLWSVADWQAKRQLLQARLVVSLGTQATAALVENPPEAPLLAALVPRQGFEYILQKNARKVSKQLSAIYLDQPLARQLAVIRAALPKARRLGVVWGPESKALAAQLRSLATAAGYQLSEVEYKPAAGGFPDLRPLLADSDVLLALADPQVFNSNSVQNVLLATFRANVPMVAFSPAYVRAGAWLSVYVTPEQVGHQIAFWAKEVLQGKSLPERPMESSDFEVGVNEYVGRSLGLVTDAASVRLQARHAEQLP